MSYISRFKALINKVYKPVLSILLAALVVFLIGVFVPKGVDLFNDNAFGKRTILSEPELVEALNAVEEKGVVMAVHGYHHEDYRNFDADTSNELVQKGVAVFKEAGLTPLVWYNPYVGMSSLSEEVQEAIQSELPRRLYFDAIDENGNEDDLLETDEIWVYESTYTLTQTMIDSNGNGNPIDDKIHNTVLVDSTETEAVTVDTEVSLSKEPGLNVTVTAGAIDITASPPEDQINARDTIAYTVRIYNTGSQTMTNIRINDTVWTQLRRNSSDENGNEDDLLETDEIWVYESTYTLTQAMIDFNGNGNPIDGKIHNTVIVDSDETNEVVVETAVPISQEPFLNVTVTAGAIDITASPPEDQINAGDTIAYTVRIYNTGSQTMTNIRVKDYLLTSLKRGTKFRTRFGNEYTYGWRDMKSFDDPRYVTAQAQIMGDQPKNIVAHFYDWNAYSKQLITDYLAKTSQDHIQLRVDDVEINTPVWKVTDLAEFVDHSKILLVSFGVIPEGTWTGGEPQLLGMSVLDIFHFYWTFFLIFCLFPFMFLLFWKMLCLLSKKFNPSVFVQASLSKDDAKPNVSIIIPAFNEENYIAPCLESILKQDYKGKMEMIVVNDGSTDRTAEIAKEYSVKVINLETNGGKANALNIGIEQSKGDIIVFSDADSELSSNAVNLLVNSLVEDPDAGAVAGKVYIKNGKKKENLLVRFQMIEYEVDQELCRFIQGLNDKVLVCPGVLFAVKREIAEKTLFSNRSVIEDSDFTIEVLKKNIKIKYQPQAKVYTSAPQSLKEWLNQRKRWMYGNLQLWQIHNHWARSNPWMVYNYFGFITATVLILLLLFLPFLFLSYENVGLAVLRGIPYTIIPILIFTLMITPFFLKYRRIILVVFPYVLIYGTIKVITLSTIYLRYIFKRGVKVEFGPSIMLVRNGR
ncbi:MAG TPA: bifunctional polysaccharide deacetylase/glycosyltransferase family 2 protein [Candidatus Thermoplasmatota archaeon]|nr:bifunctional polysaccharide deacetylase/glycosyltransferase family 2 protein [Candidatus Thermoplasmatota archaeon]